MDFKPTTAHIHVKLFYIQIVIFLALFIPASLTMLYEFYGAFGGILITIAFLVMPVVIAAASNYLPAANANVQVSAGNYQDAIVHLSSSRGRSYSGFEFNLWLFMRVSGLVLIFLALFHMFILHFVISVEQITFDTLVVRWSGALGAFWRIYDLLLLAFAFTHGMNGARNVLDDYFHSPGWRAFLKIGMFLLWFVLIGMGLFIIFTFTPGSLPS